MTNVVMEAAEAFAGTNAWRRPLDHRVPFPAGVKTPALPTVPTLDGLTDQCTVERWLPVPVTAGLQVEVWFVKTESGEHETVTDVIVGFAGGVAPPLLLPLPPPHPVTSRQSTARAT